MSRKEAAVRAAYEAAKAVYAELGVDTEEALDTLSKVSLSFPCWQLDDVNGFEHAGEHSGGGTLVTGSYPGKAGNGDEMRADAERVLAGVPGSHRFNLHAIYRETGPGKKLERDEIGPEHFAAWIDWAKSRRVGLDYNPTFFDHPLASSGFTLSHPDEAIRNFWIRHGIASRRVAEAFGAALGSVSVMNTWVPDGFKDNPVNRRAYRERLKGSLDAMYRENIDPRRMKDAVEPKLFGIGAESCTVGSHEFYLAYALERKKLLCLDMGHFHPTEQVGDKISSVLGFAEELLLHLSRPVRWDSDHVVIQDPELELVASEVVRNGYLSRVYLALDFFDATINRVAALVIGGRSVLKAFCRALLEPSAELAKREESFDFTYRLAVQEELKSLPWQAVWDYHCLKNSTPVGNEWIKDVLAYEARVVAERRS